MKNKYLTAGLIVLALSLAVPAAVFAQEGGRCAMGGKGGHEDGMFKRAAFSILKSQDELKLTKEQVQAIRDLKTETSKNLNLQSAAVKNAEIDVKAALHNDSADLASVQKLIDQKYELKKTEEKTSVEAYLKLKSILTPEQQAQFKQIRKEEHKKHGFWKKGKHGFEEKEAGKPE